jgi:two-component system KDP operon response regulator KdpE
VRPDLVILEFMLPDLNAIELIYRLRAWSKIPIVILSAHDTEPDKINALDAGAEDYIIKPFRTGELLARLRVALRRQTSAAASSAIVQVGDLVVDVAHRHVTIGRRSIALTPVEYSLLKTLALADGRVCAHQELLRAVWGPEREHDLNSLRVSVNRLRQKLEPDPARPYYIVTDTRVGYRLGAPSSALGKRATVNPGLRPGMTPDAFHENAHMDRLPRVGRQRVPKTTHGVIRG